MVRRAMKRRERRQLLDGGRTTRVLVGVERGDRAVAVRHLDRNELGVERTGVDVAFATAEVDRYISWPGQALAYMIGQLKIVEVRDRARAKLGPSFDIRKFHMAVLDQGPLPLPLLEQSIDGWIALQATPPR